MINAKLYSSLFPTKDEFIESLEYKEIGLTMVDILNYLIDNGIKYSIDKKDPINIFKLTLDRECDEKMEKDLLNISNINMDIENDKSNLIFVFEIDKE